MKKLALLTVAAGLALSGAAQAADLMVAPPAPEEFATDTGSFDWDGMFIGVYGASVFDDQISNSVGAGGFVGVNTTSDAFLFGGILSAGTFWDGTMDGQWIVQGIGRAGVLATDNILIYGLAGVGYETYNDGYYIPVGVGAEIGFADNLSIRAQYQADYVVDQDLWVSSLSTGLAVHF